ncbi:MAG TPA: hypothetical protein VNO50_04665 [Pyrinomonadaceae bacterium]|nr:hypothetical protein [Pyrinomonadaceae bacterium]
MINRGSLQSCLLAAAFVLVTLSCPPPVTGFQARDYFTPQEEELVREAQILDKRIDVFIKAVERRLLVLNGGAAAAEKQLKKDAEKWGELPTGTRAELMVDIARIFDAGISNIDDVNAKDETNPLVPKALRKLAAAATQTVERLRPLQAQTKDDAETMGFEQLVRHADEIVEAAGALPPPAEKKPKGKNKTEKPKETN